jgi:hypothetical protein
MTISQNQFTLGTVAELVCPADRNPQRVFLHNQATGTTKLIYIGNKDVTLANGVHIDVGETIQLNLNRGEALYAFSDPSGLKLGILRQKMDE